MRGQLLHTQSMLLKRDGGFARARSGLEAVAAGIPVGEGRREGAQARLLDTAVPRST